MITKFLLTGDCHANFSRFKNLPKEDQNNENLGVVILGDLGLNFTLGSGDSQLKNFLDKRYKFTIYGVRGNHEARPQDVPGMELVYDENVQGEVYLQKKWPKLRYFKDWGIYQFGDYKVAIIGGAYSVDKYYRLANGLRWFENEQLSTEEMIECTRDFTNQKIDLVLTHTCPVAWEPSDLFLPSVNQSTVDKSMELFLEELAQVFEWNVWCFGHYHSDRIERPHIEQLYTDMEDLDTLMERWYAYDEDGELEWWLIKSPNYYMEDYINPYCIKGDNNV